MLSWLMGRAPVGTAIPIRNQEASEDLGWRAVMIRQMMCRLRKAGFIRMANSSELGGGRGYVVLKRLEDA